MIKATFTPQNRMVYLELSFDVMSFMQQLRRASGKQDFQVCISPHSLFLFYIDYITVHMLAACSEFLHTSSAALSTDVTIPCVFLILLS